MKIWGTMATLFALIFTSVNLVMKVQCLLLSLWNMIAEKARLVELVMQCDTYYISHLELGRGPPTASLANDSAICLASSFCSDSAGFKPYD